MKRPSTIIHAALALCVVFLLAENAAGADQSTRDRAAGFSIGYKQLYAWWVPVWEHFDLSKVKNSALLYRREIVFSGKYTMKPDSNFLYNPVFSIRFSDKWSLSGSFLYGFFNSGKTYMASPIYQTITTSTVIQFSKSVAQKIQKYDADLLANVQVADIIKVFFGLKYQGYDYRFIRSSNMYSYGNLIVNLEDEIRFHSVGAGAGATATVHLGAGFFFIPSVSLMYLSGRDYHHMRRDFFQHYFRVFYIEKGSRNAHMTGVNGTVELAYPIRKTGLTLSLGFRCQYLYYLRNIRKNYTRNFDLFFGPNISIVYTF